MKLSDTGLRMQPFQTRGKPVVVVPNRSQSAAIRFLGETRAKRHGLGLFLGPPLSGKTSVISQFTDSLPDDCSAAVVDGADKDAGTLLQEILNQFGFYHGLDTVNERLAMTRVFAVQQAESAEVPLLIIENAHAMRPETLEMLCELAALRTHGKSALCIVLASQESMTRTLEAPNMEALSTRVTGRFLLQPLNRQETGGYVYRKLQHGGCTNPQYLVPRDVCDRMHLASGGWPGMIDGLAMTAIANADKFPLRVDHIPKVSLPKPRPATSKVAVPTLILTHLRRTLKKFDFGNSTLLIGRNQFCDLRIDDESISRQHAALLRNGQSTVVVDLKSRNGLSVNGRRVAGQVLVNDDIISLGDHRLKFIDPTARQRTTLKSAGWDEATISKSITDFRKRLKKPLISRRAS